MRADVKEDFKKSLFIFPKTENSPNIYQQESG